MARAARGRALLRARRLGHSAILLVGDASYYNRFGVSDAKTGDLWLSGLDVGLFHSTDGGATWAKLSSASSSYTLGFGKAAPGSHFQTLYQVGIVGGVTGVFMSRDDGASWQRINTDAQNWGWTGQAITGDPNHFGRVYLATNGRGIQTVDVND